MNVDVFLSPLLACEQERRYDYYVVIDLFRATTAFCTAFHYGVKEIIPFSEVEDARKMKEKGFLIAGERNGNKLDGFDFGNSPFGFMDESLKGQSLAFTTTNGTKCIDIVKDKGEVIIASYNNLSRLVDFLVEKKKDVALVCSGWKGMPNVEDSLCAGAIAKQLLQAGFLALEDSVNICIDIFNSSQEDELEYILRNSIRVKGRMNVLGDDFRKCLEKNIYQVLPVLKDGRLINL